MNLVRRALFSGWMLQGLVQNKRWFLPSSVCVNKSPAGCSPFGLCCSVSSSASTFFSFSSSVIYCTVHKFINRNSVSLVLTTFFFRLISLFFPQQIQLSFVLYWGFNYSRLIPGGVETLLFHLFLHLFIHSTNIWWVPSRCQILGCRGESLLCRHSRDLEGGGSGNSSYLVS